MEEHRKDMRKERGGVEGSEREKESESERMGVGEITT